MSSSHPPKPHPPLSTILPPLLLGTATFNTQYVADPLSMPFRTIVSRAFSSGITAFDTSPYYGPSETLLGTALHELTHPIPTPSNPTPTPVARSSFILITKVGRIKSSEFDYSPSWVRYSVLRSLKRLRTNYLDLVYCHDVEFVSPEEVLTAVKELRRLRDEEGVVKYIGISGFPVDVLASLAEKVLQETGEPLDAVMSYGNFTVQNTQLGRGFLSPDSKTDDCPLVRLKKARVDVVPNASILGMGLLTSKGIPVDPEPTQAGSPLAKWHPSPKEVRLACQKLAAIAEAAGERLETLSIRWSMEEWARVGAAAGVGVQLTSGERAGATVCGVSCDAELEETTKEWAEVLKGLGKSPDRGEYSSPRQEKILKLVREQMWPALGEWKDYAWPSLPPGFVNTRREEDKGVVPEDGIVADFERRKRRSHTP